MMSLLSEHPTPDFDGLLSILRGEKTPERVPIIEIGIDPEVLQIMQESLLGEPWVLSPGVGAPSSPDARYYQQLINLYFRLGYDFVPLWPLWINNPPGKIRQVAETANKALAAKAAMMNAMGIQVHLCGEVNLP